MKRGLRWVFAAVVPFAGCSSQYYTSQIREDGPSTEVAWSSPTATDLRNRFEKPAQVRRDFVPRTLTTADGVTPHWPIYFEDPFVAKGSGRVDADPEGLGPGGRNKYRWGWVDLFALGYSPARLLINTAGLPVSMVLEHPFTEMESDGYVSRRFLWNEYDADYASPETHERALNDLGPRMYADENAAASNDPHATLIERARQKSMNGTRPSTLPSSSGSSTPVRLSPMQPVR